jgi:hypothetical protein
MANGWYRPNGYERWFYKRGNQVLACVESRIGPFAQLSSYIASVTVNMETMRSITSEDCDTPAQAMRAGELIMQREGMI